MMKILSLLSFTAISLASNAQITVINEDFESGFPANFSDTILDANTCDSQVALFNDGWIHLQDVLDTNNHVIGASSFFDPTGTANRWFISPAINLGAYGNSITWKARSHDASFPDGYRIFISTSGNAVTDFTDTLITVATEFNDWTTHTVNLSDSGYNSQTIYFAFALQSTDKYILYLDDIKVEKENTSTLSEISSLKTSIYPNPTNGIVTISSLEKIYSLTLIDNQGKELHIDRNSSQLDLSSFSNGIYFLTIELENGNFEKIKVIKN